MRNSDKPTRLTTTTNDHELVFSQELGLPRYQCRHRNHDAASKLVKGAEVVTDL
jgi:hypothetical protein